MNACIGKGFAKDAKRTSCACHAYKTDGSHLSAMYSELSREMQIALYAPKQFTELLWSEIVMMEDVPKPRSPCGNTKIGDIMHNSSDEFIGHIGETSKDDFRAYVSACKEVGFTNIQTDRDDLFVAENSDGVSLRLEYEGFSTMYIGISAPDEEEETTSAETAYYLETVNRINKKLLSIYDE